jgi:ABC-type antimicrobial peptide transport system permease subunit
MVRTSGEPRQWEQAVAAAVRDVDPLQPVGKTVTLDEFMWASLGPQRFRSVLLLAFAGLGLLIAALGTYGVTARTVVERRREIGIRLALGGTPAVVWRSVAFATLRPILVGSVLGGVFAFLAARALPSLLPDVRTGGESGIAAAASILLAVAALAAFSAAAKAARVEPLKALRGQ